MFPLLIPVAVGLLAGLGSRAYTRRVVWNAAAGVGGFGVAYVAQILLTAKESADYNRCVLHAHTQCPACSTFEHAQLARKCMSDRALKS